MIAVEAEVKIDPDAFSRMMSMLDFDSKTRCLNWRGTVTDSGQAVLNVKFDGAWKTISVRSLLRRIAVKLWGAGLGYDKLCRNAQCQSPIHRRHGAVGNDPQ